MINIMSKSIMASHRIFNILCGKVLVCCVNIVYNNTMKYELCLLCAVACVFFSCITIADATGRSEYLDWSSGE